MATKNKGGRPPRAPGEKMTRLSVMLRPMYREALDLLAREQRTSISQALENVLAQALRPVLVEGKNVLQLGGIMAMYDDGTLGGKISRLDHQPYKTPEEQHAHDAWWKSRHLIDPDEMRAEPKYQPRLRMLFDMIAETYKMGSSADFCATMFAEAIRQQEAGIGLDHLFRYEDDAGFEYLFNLSDYFHPDAIRPE
ncbi:hypothetical protein [Pusillimonas noertemannii]|uniref:Uncharacterized protein n=1 Tax=Pusillimonas noertemannii TaxID=305977 RepID=A0A2U1CR40_9BURK|nr:hypothetical protein [Pusillimonas noertemannii]NYT67698.1 hypothetical protein [Pusillimonas noertemannii]PVY68370.1 hypothetical protein C7440_0767 [Pusillimonas noertemannii]TFL12146.1 hypothetical protein CSC72_03220 [Pusillimonas noertemannii]